ncbi:hypothetical protein [Roseibacillus persicicus]|uniref:Sulfotransferase domain-containing protein n=1 Tax=Roseibacillus persicicus TaxID=454148 RepID=A0A918TT47_9BACT|nr:hypothetical protein [Roseibacillus persicicus]GHC61346.1 hypothetical protein GCM10007100_30820 [Roseibacillus persicicus]
MFEAWDKKKLQNTKVIAIYRDPYERFCSTVRHFIYSERASVTDLEMGKIIEEQFIDINCFVESFVNSKDTRNQFVAHPLFLPQKIWVSSLGGTKIDVALFSIDELDKLEQILNLESDSGIQDRRIKKTNVTLNGDERWDRALLTKRSESLIKKYYSQDFKMIEEINAEGN